MYPTALTGPREQLGDLLAFRHVLDGSVDLLSDGQHQTLPFQVAVPSVHQPVCGRDTQTTALPYKGQKRYDSGYKLYSHWLRPGGSWEDGNEDRPEGMLAGAKQTLATCLPRAIASTQGQRKTLTSSCSQSATSDRSKLSIIFVLPGVIITFLTEDDVQLPLPRGWD